MCFIMLSSHFLVDQIPLFIYIIIMMVISLFGNGITCFIYGYRLRQTVTRNFILALSVLDIISSVVCMPLEIYIVATITTFKYSVLCKFSRYLTYVAHSSTSLILLAIAWDRFYKVCRPLKTFFNVLKSRRCIIIILIFSFTFALPAIFLYGTNVLPNINGTTCSISEEMVDTPYPLMFFVVYTSCFLFVAINMIVLYWKIIKEIKILKKTQDKRHSGDNVRRSLAVTRIHVTNEQISQSDGFNIAERAGQMQVSSVESTSSNPDCVPPIPPDVDHSPKGKNAKAGRERLPMPASVGNDNDQMKIETNDILRPKKENNIQDSCQSNDQKRIRGITNQSAEEDVENENEGPVNLGLVHLHSGSGEVMDSCRIDSETSGHGTLTDSEDERNAEPYNARFSLRRQTNSHKEGSENVETAATKTNSRPVSRSSVPNQSKSIYNPGKTTRMLLTVSACFFLSFLPFFTIVIYRKYVGVEYFFTMDHARFITIGIFIRSYLVSNAVNPVIYGFLNQNFRTQVEKLFKGKLRSTKSRFIISRNQTTINR